MKEILEKLQKLSEKMPVGIRGGLASRMAESFVSGQIKEEDRETVEEIFRLLARDVEMQVRKALAENIKNSSLLPRDVVLVLARDIAEVADPLVQYSPVLSDSDMLELLKETKSVSTRVAMASRQRVGLPLTIALIESGEDAVAKTIINNRGAELNDDAILEIADRFPDNGEIINMAMDRYPLPLPVAEKLISKISEGLRREIIAKTNVSAFALEDALQSTHEWASIQLMSGTPDADLHKFVEHLYNEAKLTPSLMIRALICGYARFFVAAVAVRAGVSSRNAVKLLNDPGPLGFRAIYKAATLPPGVAEAIRVVFQLAWQITGEGREILPEFPKRLLEKIMVGGYDRSVDNMSFVTAIIGRNIP